MDIGYGQLLSLFDASLQVAGLQNSLHEWKNGGLF